MSKLKKYRRAVSPVVTTIFLFGVILSAIAVALGIIYPSVNRLDDQISLEQSGSSLVTVDGIIEDLITQGSGGQVRTRLDLGIGSQLQYNNLVQSTVRMVEDGGTILYTSTINVTRLQITQEVNSDFIAEGSTTYFTGAGDQSLIYLNDTSRKQLGWSVIQQQRPIASDSVTTSLYYRSIISYEAVIDPRPFYLDFNTTVTINLVNITLSSSSDRVSSGTNVGMSMQYLGSTQSVTDWYAVPNNFDFGMVVVTQYPDGTLATTEYPLSLEAAQDLDNYFRFSFKMHQIEITI